MIDFLHLLFYGRRMHQHKWNLIDTVIKDDPWEYVGKCYVLQCTECGNIKVRKS
jgi:hypothetical protein